MLSLKSLVLFLLHMTSNVLFPILTVVIPGRNKAQWLVAQFIVTWSVSSMTCNFWLANSTPMQFFRNDSWKEYSPVYSMTSNFLVNSVACALFKKCCYSWKEHSSVTCCSDFSHWFCFFYDLQFFIDLQYTCNFWEILWFLEGILCSLFYD